MIADRYTLEREVGRGGMGVVWLGRDEILGRAVALKRIGMFPGGTRPDLERAVREARLAATLNHPHVVAVFDLVTHGEEQWLVMEYVEGLTLAGLVQRDGPRTPDEVARVAGQAADALAAAHAAGIVHRDVKPSNILVTPAGQAKITDFGIARAEADASLTQTGLVTGSPAYLAPEVASGHAATGSSDVWSLGSTMFYALAGRPPYDVGENVFGALYKIVNEEPPRLNNAGWLTPLLESTMATDPADRWSMERVRQFLSSGPGASAPDPPTQTMPVAPDRTMELSHAVPAAPEGRHAAEPTPEPEPAPQRTPEPTPEPMPAPSPQRPGRSRRPGALRVVAALAVLALLGLAGWAVVRGLTDEPGAGSRSNGKSSTSAPQPDGPTEEDMASFVEDYLATVTTDPASSWERLTPAFQEESGGLAGYVRFWRTIRSASPTGIRADPDAMTVSYSVVYDAKNGKTSTDEVTLTLVEDEDGGLLISGER